MCFNQLTTPEHLGEPNVVNSCPTSPDLDQNFTKSPSNENPNSISERLPSDTSTEKITILKRNSQAKRPDEKLLYPIRPYHERYREYVSRRNEIFDVDVMQHITSKRPKRSTVRLRRYHKLSKISAKYMLQGL